MAYRYRAQTMVKYGHFNDVVSALHQLNEICQKRGWTASRILTPFVGEGNLVVMETDYPDLATFEREAQAFQSDAEAMKVWRATAEFVVEGSNRDEIYVDAPTLA